MTDTFTTGSKPTLKKDPEALLDYIWDWTDYLTDISDTIETYTVAVEEPLVVEEYDRLGNKITAFISGGVAGTTSVATCHITTVGGRADDRSIYLKIVER